MFDDCRGKKRPLPFDFVIIENKIAIKLIEFQGIQHYNKIKRWGKTLEQIQNHDKIKKNYSIGKGIPLLIIPHWDFEKIYEILNDFLIGNLKL